MIFSFFEKKDIQKSQHSHLQLIYGVNWGFSSSAHKAMPSACE
jgi:hypothetical protein